MKPHGGPFDQAAPVQVLHGHAHEGGMLRLTAPLAALVLFLSAPGCGDDDDGAPSTDPSSEQTGEQATGGEGGAIRLGQCGYVKPGAIRGGTQGMTVDTAGFGPGVPIELDTLQVRPVVGNWACLLRTVVDDDPPAARSPADLGRFVLLREERRTVDASQVEPTERWLWVTDPDWVSEVERLRERVSDAQGQPGALERICEEVGRARPDPDHIRSEAVTAMRQFVATGQVREEVSVSGDDLVQSVRRIGELCGW